MDMDGSNLQQLTTNLNLGDTGTPGQSPGGETEDCRLTWKPDETELALTGITAYLPNPPESRYNVYTINADGSNLIQLTDCHLNYNFVSDCGSPNWSPDGTLIVFSDDDVTFGDNLGGAGIYTISTSNGSISPIFQQLSWHNWFPHYSTDGKKFFYTADPNLGLWSIYSRNSDGTEAVQIVTGNNKINTQGSFDINKCGNFGHL
jgi:hypothetical protein